MKFGTTFKMIKILSFSALVASGVIATTIATTMKQNTTNKTVNDAKSQTGKIIHNANTQVVNNVNEIAIQNTIIGESISYAIVNNNNVQEMYVWGNNEYGQLGLNHLDPVNNPTKFDLSVFGEYSALEINFVGDDTEANEKSYAANVSYAIVSKNNTQELYLWGANHSGLLGLGNVKEQKTPRLIHYSLLGNYDSIESIQGCKETIFIITNKNNAQEVYAAGSNTNGELGNGNWSDKNKFTLIPKIKLGYYEKIKSFRTHAHNVSVVIERSNGELELYVWGDNASGQLGINTTVNANVPKKLWYPMLASEALKVSQVQIDSSSYAWNKETNTIFVWGKNTAGQLGLGHANAVLIPIQFSPVSIGLEIIKEFKLGNSSYAISQFDIWEKHYVWGTNTSGCLGLGNTTNVTTPTQLSQALFNAGNIKKFSISKNDSLSSYAIVENINKDWIYMWGNNSYGQLGTGNFNDILRPTKFTKMFEFPLMDFELSRNSKLVMNNNGHHETYFAGYNQLGQLGLGTNTKVADFTKALPTRVTEIKPLQKSFAISAADALKSVFRNTNIPNKTRLAEYVDISSFPSNAHLWIDSNTKINVAEGYIDLVLNTNSYYDLLVTKVVEKNKKFPIRIKGFEYVSNTQINIIKTPNMSSAKFYEKLIVNNTIDRAFLAQYADLSCIPSKAAITIERLDEIDTKKIEFKLTSDYIYSHDDYITEQEYSQILNFTLTGTLDPIIIAGIVTGTILSAAMLGMIIYLLVKKFKYVKALEN